MDGQLHFGSSIIGKPSHEAFIKLQEYEIKLLEVKQLGLGLIDFAI